MLAAVAKETEGLEPRNLGEVMKQLDWILWKQAMEEELTMLQSAGIWELVDPH